MEPAQWAELVRGRCCHLARFDLNSFLCTAVVGFYGLNGYGLNSQFSVRELRVLQLWGFYLTGLISQRSRTVIMRLLGRTNRRIFEDLERVDPAWLHSYHDHY